ncbi:hypothetical protein C8R47DRAFT_1157381, partial [Mycena vitilis]
RWRDAAWCSTVLVFPSRRMAMPSTRSRSRRVHGILFCCKPPTCRYNSTIVLGQYIGFDSLQSSTSRRSIRSGTSKNGRAEEPCVDPSHRQGAHGQSRGRN